VSEIQEYDLPPELPSEDDLDAPLGSQVMDWLRMQPPALLVVVALAFIVMVIMGVLIVRSLVGDTASPLPSDSPTLDPTLQSEYTLPIAAPIVIDNDAPQTEVNSPSSISMKGLDFQVLPYVVQPGGEWRYPAGQSSTAVWVYGTIINYVIGIEQTKANVAMLESFSPGDEITMTTSSGATYYFGFAGREEVDSTNTDILAQKSPGLTLVTLGGSDDGHLVVHGEYLAAQVTGGRGIDSGLSVAVGEPAQLDDVRVTVLETAYLYETVDTPEGWAFFLVEYQVENLSQTILNPDRFRMELQDGTGNVYSPNLTASRLGSFGYLMLTIPPNTVAMGTAGYLVPAPLQGPRLSWSFSHMDSPDRVAKIMIDFEIPQETADPVRLAAISLTGAELSGDRTLVSVWGNVLNNGEEELVIALEDVTLRGAEESTALRAADPAFPWNIPPGTSLSFRLAFQRPSSSIATFTMLNQPFEISGLD
jgi:hypothetical protein